MRFNAISTLAVVLNLGASGVLSRVIPVTRGAESSSQLLAVETILCIRDFCATKLNSTQCGSVSLSVTPHEAPPSIEECVAQFRNLIPRSAGSRSSHTQSALYEIYTKHDDRSVANRKRGVHVKKAKSIKLKTTKTRKTKAKTTKSGKPKTKKPTP